MKWKKKWLDDKSGYWFEIKKGNLKFVMDEGFNYYFIEVQTLNEKGKKKSWEIIRVFKTRKKLEKCIKQIIYDN